MSTFTERHATMQDHLDALWPPEWRHAALQGPAQPFLVLSHPDPAKLRPNGEPSWVSAWHRMPSMLDAAIARTLQRSGTHNEYYGVNLGHPDCHPAPGKRLKKQDVVIVPGLLGDFDGAWGAHKGAALALPDTLGALLAFLHALPSPPTRIVDTGGGLHTYHLFPEPWRLDTPDARAAFLDLATRFQAAVECWAHERHGWTNTSTFTADLSRVLRLPGTINHKYGTVITTLEATGRRWRPEELNAWLPPTCTHPPRASAPGAARGTADTLDLEALAAHYGMALTRKSEEEWCGSHPVHGSDTGTNVSINPGKQLWHCHRHTTGGDALAFVAVCEGLLPCEHAKPYGLRGGAYLTTVRLANAHFQAGIILDADRLDDAQTDVEARLSHRLFARLTAPLARQVTTSLRSSL